MGDSWEDEEFEVPKLAPKVDVTASKKVSNNWDDEEDETLKQVNTPIKNELTEEQKELLLKKQLEEKRLMELKMKHDLEMNESAQERSLRVKAEQEKSDQLLAQEMLGLSMNTKVASNTASELASKDTNKMNEKGAKGFNVFPDIELNTDKEFETFSKTIKSKLSTNSSTPKNLEAFYKSLLEGLRAAEVPLNIVESILSDFIKIRDDKLINMVPMQKEKNETKSKKSISMDKKKHATIFGNLDNDDDYYIDVETDLVDRKARKYQFN